MNRLETMLRQLQTTVTQAIEELRSKVATLGKDVEETRASAKISTTKFHELRSEVATMGKAVEMRATETQLNELRSVVESLAGRVSGLEKSGRAVP